MKQKQNFLPRCVISLAIRSAIIWAAGSHLRPVAARSRPDGCASFNILKLSTHFKFELPVLRLVESNSLTQRRHVEFNSRRTAAMDGHRTAATAAFVDADACVEVRMEMTGTDDAPSTFTTAGCAYGFVEVDGGLSPITTATSSASDLVHFNGRWF